jgi:hypothetical protein
VSRINFTYAGSIGVSLTGSVAKIIFRRAKLSVTLCQVANCVSLVAKVAVMYVSPAEQVIRADREASVPLIENLDGSGIVRAAAQFRR